MGDESNARINSVRVDAWGTGDRNDCYWNIAKNLLEGTKDAGNMQAINELCEQLQQYNKEKNVAIQDQGQLLLDGDEVFIPLDLAKEEIEANITAKQEELTTAQDNLTTAQTALSDANSSVSSTLSAYQTAMNNYNGAAEDADNKEELKSTMDAAKQAYLDALAEQKEAQNNFNDAKSEVETKKSEMADYVTQLEEIQTEYTEEMENYKDAEQDITAKIESLNEQIATTETSLQQAEAQQQAATQQQEDASQLGVTTAEDGTLTLDDSNLTSDDIDEATEGTDDVLEAAEFTNKEVGSQTVSEDGNTKTVYFADGTSAVYTKDENGEWQAMPDTMYDEGENPIPEGSVSGDGTGAEATKETILANLDADAPSDVEFELDEETGLYTTEYVKDYHESWGSYYTKSVVTYDPETGITTVKNYDVTNNEDHQLEEDQEPTSVTEYNKNTNTKTQTFVSSADVYTTVYADDSMSDDAKLRVSCEENGNLISVVTYSDGERTGVYNATYDENNEITEFSITDANGVRQTISLSELADITDDSGSQIGSSQIKSIMNDIKNGESPKAAFKNHGGDNLMTALTDKNIQLSDTSTRNGEEETTYMVDEAASLCLTGVNDLELSGEIEENDGVYTMKYTGTDASGGQVEYQVTYDPATGITNFNLLDEEGNATESSYKYNSQSLTIEQYEDGNVTFSKITYDENDDGSLATYTDKIEVNYDDSDKINQVTITDTEGHQVSLDAQALKEAGITQTEIDDIFNKLTEGTSSPRAILESHFKNGELDELLLGENNDEESFATYNELCGFEESSFDIENFEEEFEAQVNAGTVHDYLINNVTSDNIMDIITHLQSDPESDFSIMGSLWNLNSSDEFEKSSELLVNILSGVDIDELKENGQYDAYINFVVNEFDEDIYKRCYQDGQNQSKNYSPEFANGLIQSNRLGDEVLLDILNNCRYTTSTYLTAESNDIISKTAMNKLVSDDVSSYDGSTTYSAIAEDIVARILVNSFDENIIQTIIDKGTEEYNEALLHIAQKYSDRNNNYSMMRKFENNEALCDAYANAISSLFDTDNPERNEIVAKILANDLYYAMEGANSREYMLEAILGNNDNGKSRISKENTGMIEDAFNKANYKNTKLWKYISDQWSIDATRQAIYKQNLDENWSE